MSPLSTIYYSLSTFFRSPLRKWSSVFLLAVLALGGAYYYQIQSLGKAQAAYTIANSARFISGNSDYLSKTPAGAGTRTTWTYSVWVKKSAPHASNDYPLFSAGSASDDLIKFDNGNNTLRWYVGNTAGLLVTSQVFRDPAAWQHLVFVYDSSNATANNRMRIYLNGTAITDFSSRTNPAQNTNSAFNNTVEHDIGRNGTTATTFYDGYMSDVYFIDGAALAPTCFGETDSNGYWRPKTYSTASPCAAYGTNGFKLAFGTGSALGTDTSGNANNWATSTNMTAAVSQLTDSPTNSFATGNPLQPSSGTLTQGNLVSSGLQRATFFPTTGKWYWEVKANAVSVVAGIITDSGTAVTTSVSNGTTMGFEFDADAGTLATTTDGSTFIGTVSNLTGGRYPYATGASNTFNFGQGGQSGLTYDSASGGTFKYTPPSGYKALSTANMSAPTVTIPKNYFDAVTYTGSGTATSTWSGFVAFQPDIVWLKDRTSANAHGIFASSTVLYPAWASNATNAEGGAGGTALTGFLSNGFSLGASSTVNTSGDNFISWLWKESVTSGMDIVSYTGTGANRTISHSLATVPDMMIVKRRDSTGNSTVYHGSLTASTTQILLLNTTAAVATDATAWNSTAPTASVFSLGTNVDVNASAGTYVAYLFKGIDGFSKFGSYTGNGSADGPFVYTGFKPRYVMIKQTNVVKDWTIRDTARDTYNPTVTNLYPHTTDVDTAGGADYVDVLSNGFKIRTTGSTHNTSGGTYVYVAFADVPFYYSAQAAATAASTFVSAVAFLMGMAF